MLKLLDRLEEWIITFLMGAATLIIFVSAVHRYGSGFDIPGVQDWLLGLNLGWTQELTIIMFVWMAKFGAAYGVRTGIHVGVDVLINRLSPANRGRFIVLGLGAGALFTGIVGTLGASFVLENGAHYQLLTWFGMDTEDFYEGPTTPDLEWPTWMVYAAIPLGSYLMCFRFLQVIVGFLRTGELRMADFMIGTGVGVIGFLIMANILMLIAGNFMEPSSIVLILAPILFPIAIKLGIDPVHFGIIMVVNMEVGMCHPPVGLNLYVASGITKMGITELTVAVWPWLLTMLVFLVLVTYVPVISLWLPRTLGML